MDNKWIPGQARNDNPTDYIISRKRKKFKFASFDSWENCFSRDEWIDFYNNNPEIFNAPVVAEIGAGSALFLLEQAKLFPQKIFVAIDVKSDRLYQGARDANLEKINNIYFVRSDIADLAELFASKSLSEIWLTFSDPYPKKSDAKHRLTYKRYLDLYRQVLMDGGKLNFKTDNDGLFEYSVESFTENGWKIIMQTTDLHAENNLPENYKIMTSYETRFYNEGKNINFLIAN